MTPESPLDALRRLDQEAAAAPWRPDSYGCCVYADDDLIAQVSIGGAEGTDKVVDLIVTLRNTLPALLRLVDTVETQMQAWDQAEAIAIAAAQARGIATARGADGPTRSALRAALAALTTPAASVTK